MSAGSSSRPGAHPDGAGTTFVALATRAESVAVRLFDAPARPTRDIALVRSGGSGAIFSVHVPGVSPGALYKFVVDGDEVPDPYARFLPFGVHGPARVVSPASAAPLARPPAPHRWSIYELHVGAFTPEGTYRAAADRLREIAALGVTAVELMPIAAFPGDRGWGYDGVALFAPFAPYGEPDDVRAFVRAAHDAGLAVILDVVYNHFGPSGNYLAKYAPEYFGRGAETRWGGGPDFHWYGMRELVLANVRYWFEEFGFDALRLDATHAIDDPSEPHVLREITEIARALGRRVFFEDDRNDPRVFEELGADGVWADDLHHQLHVLLTGERDGYYAAYEPSLSALATCIRDGWTFTGQPYSPWQGRARGHAFGDRAREHLVVCVQNHDQVGNRAFGDRLSSAIDVDAYLAAVALLLFLPTTPLLFMGQEWAASTPFLFFSDHEGELGENVSRGRRDEFAAFSAFADSSARGEIPDPQARSTFDASKLRWDEQTEGEHARVLAAHAALLHLRRDDEVLSRPCAARDLDVEVDGDVLVVTRRADGKTRRLLVGFDRALTAPSGSRILFREARAVIVAGD